MTLERTVINYDITTEQNISYIQVLKYIWGYDVITTTEWYDMINYVKFNSGKHYLWGDGVFVISWEYCVKDNFTLIFSKLPPDLSLLSFLVLAYCLSNRTFLKVLAQRSHRLGSWFQDSTDSTPWLHSTPERDSAPWFGICQYNELVQCKIAGLLFVTLFVVCLAISRLSITRMRNHDQFRNSIKWVSGLAVEESKMQTFCRI